MYKMQLTIKGNGGSSTITEEVRDPSDEFSVAPVVMESC